MALLRRNERGFEASGRLYQFGGDATRDDRPWSGQYITMQATRRVRPAPGGFSLPYCGPGALSASAPGVCWFRD